MIRRPSLRSALTTVAAAAVLVGGANLAAYAANGHPLLLGKSNKAVGTTALKNLGRGPALSLNSAKSSAPLKVNSSKMVKHLNANKTGGKTAGQLEPKTTTFRLGSPGQSFTGGDIQLFTASVPKGTYAVDIAGFITEPSSDPSDSYTCLVADKAALLRILGGTATPSDLALVYAVDGGSVSDSSFTYGVVDNYNSSQVIRNRSIGYGCVFNSSASTPSSFVMARPVVFTLRAVTAANKSGTPLATSRTGARNLIKALR